MESVIPAAARRRRRNLSGPSGRGGAHGVKLLRCRPGRKPAFDLLLGGVEPPYTGQLAALHNASDVAKMRAGSRAALPSWLTTATARRPPDYRRVMRRSSKDAGGSADLLDQAVAVR
jgi:hypothetical protein